MRSFSIAFAAGPIVACMLHVVGLGHQKEIQLVGHEILRVFSRETSPLGRFWCKSIFQDRDGRYWFGDDAISAAAQYDAKNSQWNIYVAKEYATLYHGVRVHQNAILPKGVRSIVQTRDDTLWFAADWTDPTKPVDGVNLSSFDGVRWSRYPIEVNKTRGTRIGLVQGRNGTAWFWNGDSVMKHDGARWSPPIKLEQLLTRVEEKANSLDKNAPGPEAIKRANIRSALQTRNGNLWLLTSLGLVKLNESLTQCMILSETRRSSSNKILYEDRKGRLWLSSIGTLEIFDPATNGITRLSLHILDREAENVLMVSSVYQDKLGRHLLAVQDGSLGFEGRLLVYYEAEDKWEFVELAKVGLSGDAHIIMEDNLGKIWISTSDGVIVLKH